MWNGLLLALNESQRDRRGEPHILARSVERRRLRPHRRCQKSLRARVEELGQESPTFEAVPVRHGRPTDVRTLWSPDNGLQLLSVWTAIAGSLFLHLSANFIF